MEFSESNMPIENRIPWIKCITIFIIAVLIVVYIYDVAKRNYGSDAVKFWKRETRGKVQVTLEEKRKRRNGFIKDLLSLFIPLALMMFIWGFVFGISVILSGSMEPTLMTGNTVFINRLAYKTGHDVERGDIIFFTLRRQGVKLDYGKRVIGLPGDTVEFQNGCVVINGQFIDESAYLPEGEETNSRKTFSVPEGYCFVLGDNRKNSYDSRYWENPYVDMKDIQGKYMGQINFSFQRDVFHTITVWNK